MVREKNLDNKIAAFCEKKSATARKIHGSAVQNTCVDWLICYKGKFIALETKASDGIPSMLQLRYLQEVQRSGGIGEVPYNMLLVESIFRYIDNDKIDEWPHDNHELLLAANKHKR